MPGADARDFNRFADKPSQPVRFLVRHHPFYLLSALCMIAGCYILNSARSHDPGDLGALLVLIGTINAYELLLIGLGLFLARGLTRRMGGEGAHS